MQLKLEVRNCYGNWNYNENATLIPTTTRKQTALDRGKIDRVSLTLDLDLDIWPWPSISARYSRDLHTCKSSRSKDQSLLNVRRRVETNGGTDGRRRLRYTRGANAVGNNSYSQPIPILSNISISIPTHTSASAYAIWYDTGWITDAKMCRVAGLVVTFAWHPVIDHCCRRYTESNYQIIKSNHLLATEGRTYNVRACITYKHR